MRHAVKRSDTCGHPFRSYLSKLGTIVLRFPIFTNEYNEYNEILQNGDKPCRV
jgi:hypothetical protein